MKLTRKLLAFPFLLVGGLLLGVGLVVRFGLDIAATKLNRATDVIPR